MSNVELNTEERQKLLAVLRELDDHAVERRRDKRHEVTVHLYVRKVKSAHPQKGDGDIGLYPAEVLNVAARGVGFKVQNWMAVGDQVVLPLRFREGGGWLVLCQVRSCSPLSDGSYRVGAKFLERIDDPEGVAKVPVDWLL
jgi:hypothetical protein